MAHNEHTLSADCPIECLRGILSGKAFNPLARAYRAPFEPPRTVADVIRLVHGDRLKKIYGLGSRRISEIEASLVFAGIDIGNTSRHEGTS